MEITISYQPDHQTAKIRCDYSVDDEEDRDERVEALWEAVYETTLAELRNNGLVVTGGGEDSSAENAIVRSFRNEVPQA